MREDLGLIGCTVEALIVRRRFGAHYIYCTVEARKLEHGFRRISAGIPYTLPDRHEDNDVPTFWLLL